MSIFKKIENQEAFSVDDLKGKIQTKKVKGTTYNPLHYALVKENFNYAKDLIHYLKEQNPETLRNWYFNQENELFYAYFRNSLYHKTFPIQHELLYSFFAVAKDDEEVSKILMMALIGTNYREKDDLNIEKVKAELSFPPQFNSQVYNTQYNLSEIIKVSNLMHPISLKEKVTHFKSSLLEMSQEEAQKNKYFNLNKENQEDIQIISSFLSHITKELNTLPVDTLNQSDIEKVVKKINEVYNSFEYFEKTVILGNSRQTQYLKENTQAIKIKYIQKTLKDAIEIESEDFNDYLTHHYFKNPLIQEEKLNEEKLKKITELFKQKNFKSLSFDKSINLDDIIYIIEKGSNFVEQIFNLKEKEVGGNRLHLSFVNYKSHQNGAAGYLPSGNKITFYMDSHKDLELKSRHFAHEYTHYLQDIEHYLSQVKYDEKTNHIYDKYPLWLEIQKEIYQHEISLEDAINYSIQMYDVYAKDVIIKKETFLTQIKENFQSENYFEKIEKMLPYTREEPLLEFLKAIKKGYTAKTFFESVWSELDKNANAVYCQHQLEIHARLVEKLTPIMNHVLPEVHYPVDNLVAKIKPKLEAFNRLIAKDYKELLKYEKEKERWNLNFSEKRKNYLDSFDEKNRFSHGYDN